MAVSGSSPSLSAYPSLDT